MGNSTSQENISALTGAANSILVLMEGDAKRFVIPVISDLTVLAPLVIMASAANSDVT